MRPLEPGCMESFFLSDCWLLREAALLRSEKRKQGSEREYFGYKINKNGRIFGKNALKRDKNEKISVQALTNEVRKY